MKHISTFFVKSLLISLLFILQFSFVNAANCPGTFISERPALPGKGCCGLGTNASLPYWNEEVGSCLNVSCTNKPGPFNLFQLSIGWNAGSSSDPLDSSVLMNIPYTYAPVNTGEKCEFHCVWGSAWDDTLKECVTCANGGCGVGGNPNPSTACKNNLIKIDYTNYGPIDSPSCTIPETNFRCKGVSPDVNATPCKTTGSNLSADINTSSLVDSCSPTTKMACEYVCREGYYKNGSACSPYTCQDTAGKLNVYTNTFAKPDNLELTNNTTEYSFSGVGDTSTKCEFNCLPGSAYNSLSGTCEVCGGAGCTVNQCNNGSDNPPLCDSSPVYSCIGTAPSNASECPLSHVVSLDTNIPPTVNNGKCDSFVKCQYECNVGYRLSGGVCVRVSIPISGKNGCNNSAIDWSNALTGSSCHASGVNLLSGELDTVTVSTGYFPTLNTATRTVQVSCTDGVLSTNENSVWCGYLPTCQNGGWAANDFRCQCTNIDGVTKTDYLNTFDAYINSFVYSPSLCSNPSNKITSTCISSNPSILPSFQSSTNATYASCVTRSAEFDPPTCEIAEGASTCPATVYATTTNLTGEAVLTDGNATGVYIGYPTNGGVDVPVVFASTTPPYGKYKVTIPYAGGTYQLWDATSTGPNAHSFGIVAGTASCASGLGWDGNSCEKNAAIGTFSSDYDLISYDSVEGYKVNLTWNVANAFSCHGSDNQGTSWGGEKATSSPPYTESSTIFHSTSDASLDSTLYDLICIGASGQNIATTTEVRGCSRFHPIAFGGLCVDKPTTPSVLVKFPYAKNAHIDIQCRYADQFDVIKNGLVAQASTSLSMLSDGSGNGTGTVSLLTSAIKDNYIVSCYKMSSDNHLFVSKYAFDYKSTPPSPIVSLRASPANMVKGATTVINWDVTFPNSVQQEEPLKSTPCVLIAKAICPNNVCTSDITQEEIAVNLILTSSSTDTKDKYGSRPIASSTQYLTTQLSPTAISVTPPVNWLNLPYNLEVLAPYTAWKASGRKTFKLNSSMNFNLKCGDGPGESRSVRVMVTDNVEG